jgi:ribonuclease BN (tRNA processing enzyme)
MKWTILGKYGPFPAAGGACSGYLVESGTGEAFPGELAGQEAGRNEKVEGNGTRVLVECGNGVLSKLQQVCDIRDLDAIVLSHLHSDHMSDMMVLRYALDIWKARGLYSKGPLPVYLPESPQEVYNQIASAQAFQPIPIKDGMKAAIGSLSLTFREMTHPVQSFAMAIENHGKKIVYTGDTNWNPHIESFADGADLLLADAGLLERDKVPGKSPHLSAEEVGRIARAARVKNLVLTHIWPGYDEKDLLDEAAMHYANPVMAEEMKTYNV